MRADLELTLSFDGDHWVTDIDHQRIRAGELPELEHTIIQTVRQLPCFAKHDCVQVRLAFDFDVIPDWLRQYHGHYFNSCLTVTMPVDNPTVAAVQS
ncbi:MAG: DUF5395 family protein [Gammaproteobacteria bacterium]|nr:DUF5395 family protein [Gammaproteobacteria bacterium]